MQSPESLEDSPFKNRYFSKLYFVTCNWKFEILKFLCKYYESRSDLQKDQLNSYFYFLIVLKGKDRPGSLLLAKLKF